MFGQLTINPVLWFFGPFAFFVDAFVTWLHEQGIKVAVYTNAYGQDQSSDQRDIRASLSWGLLVNVFLAVAVVALWQPLIRPAITNLLLNPAPQVVVNPPVVIVPSQTLTATATPLPTETLLPTPTPILTPTPTATALSYSFGSSIKAETLQVVMEHLSMQPEDFVYNLTENVGSPAVAAYGEVVSYELSDKGLYLLFATTDGILKAKIDYFVVPGRSYELYELYLVVDELTYDQALQVRDYLDKGINELDKDPRDPFGHQGTWIVIEAITSEAGAEKCKNDLASLDNWEELCFYNSPSWSTITPQEIEEMIRGAIVPTTVLDVNSLLPLLFFGEDVSARLSIQVP